MACSSPSFQEPRPVALKDLKAAFPPVTRQGLRTQIHNTLASIPPRGFATSLQHPVLVVLDDDPTALPTCHGTAVLAVWDQDTLADEIHRTRPGSGFFILTNTRGLTAREAQERVTEICTNLQAAAATAKNKKQKKRFDVVLRIDPFLRGHFFPQHQAVENVLGPLHATVLVPFAPCSGYYTAADVQWCLGENDKTLVAGLASSRELKADDASGNGTGSGHIAISRLPQWAEAQSHGYFWADQTVSINIQTLQAGGQGQGVERVYHTLAYAQNSRLVLINALETEDLDVVVRAQLRLTLNKKQILFLAAGEFVASRLDIQQTSPNPNPFSFSSIQHLKPTGGDGIAGELVAVCSTLAETTEQIKALNMKSSSDSSDGVKNKYENNDDNSGRHSLLTTIQLDVKKLVQDGGVGNRDGGDDTEEYLQRTTQHVEAGISRGQGVLLMTSREPMRPDKKENAQAIQAAISAALVTVVAGLKTRPRYVIVKGGITTAEMAAKALKFRRAVIVGEVAAAGVALWRCVDRESKWCGIPFVAFPGKAGTTGTLFDLVDGWRLRQRPS